MVVSDAQTTCDHCSRDPLGDHEVCDLTAHWTHWTAHAGEANESGFVGRKLGPLAGVGVDQRKKHRKPRTVIFKRKGGWLRSRSL